MANANSPNLVYSTIPLIGIGLNKRTNTATETNPIEFQLGTTVIDANSKVWVYIHAPLAIGSCANVTLAWSTANPPSVDGSSIGAKTLLNYVNGSQAFAADDYGWVQSVRRLGMPQPDVNP